MKVMFNMSLFGDDSQEQDEIKTYDVYHDEIREDGFWHCFLFIPLDRKEILNDLIIETRENLGYEDPIHYSSVNAKAKSHHIKPRFIKALNTIASFAIQNQKHNADLYLGHKDRKPVYKKGDSCNKINAKMAVFRDIGNHRDMYEGMTVEKKFETTFRMGLKGANHCLFYEDDVIIRRIFHDYGSRIPFDQQFNEDNIIQRLVSESHSNIEFDQDIRICTIAKSNLDSTIMDHIFLQLADVVIGSIRTRLLNHTHFPARFEASYPYDEILKKDFENLARMKNSRFYKGYTLTNASIISEEWTFDNMRIEQLENNQLKLLEE